MMDKKPKRSATLQEDGTVLLVLDKFTSKVVLYDKSLHDTWPDLEHPKQKRRKRVKKDDAEGNVEPGAAGDGLCPTE